MTSNTNTGLFNNMNNQSLLGAKPNNLFGNSNTNTNINPLSTNNPIQPGQSSGFQTGSNFSFGNTSANTNQNPIIPTGGNQINNLFSNQTNPTTNQTNFLGNNPNPPLTSQLTFGNSTNTTSNLFGNANSNKPANIPQTNFNNPGFQTNQGLFSNQAQTANNIFPNQSQYVQNIPVNYNQTQILTLMPSNQTKYEKVISLQSNELKELIKLVEVSFENNRLYLNNLDTSINSIQENYKIIQSEAFNIAKFTKLINGKNSKLKFILQNFKNELKVQNDVLNQNRENCKILEHHPSLKITIPSEYFLDLVKEIEDYSKSHIKQISDLESLFNLYYQKEMGSFKMCSDIIEHIIESLYESLIGLTVETSRICDTVENLKKIYYDFLKNQLGWKDYDIENKFRQAFNPINTRLEY